MGNEPKTKGKADWKGWTFTITWNALWVIVPVLIAVTLFQHH